ncbi:fungal-specific transcription factor domain-containing protein [Peziza echinospora]|nr:fungal-specific transcription factor domain-containing protein [Peziza echinospora]
MDPQGKFPAPVLGGGSSLPKPSLVSAATAGTNILHSKPQPRQIHRNRASYSCHSCRRRKIKCDKAHPSCGHCLKLEVDCEYNETTPARSGQRGKSAGSSSDTSTTPPAEPSSKPPKSAKNKRARTNGSSSDGDEIQYVPPTTASQEFLAGHLWQPNGHIWQANLNPQSERDLEQRSYLLAQCLDQWYRDHHKQKPGSDALSSESQAQSLAHLKLQLRWIMQPKSKILPSDLLSFTVKPNNETGPLYYLATPEIMEMVTNIFKVTSRMTEAANLSRGRLDIQEQGITRYTGNGFWDLNEDHEHKVGHPKPSGVTASSSAPQEMPLWKQLQNSKKSRRPKNGLPFSAEVRPPSFGTASTNDYVLLNPDTNECLLNHKIMTSTLPTRSQSDILYKAYVRGVHPILPLIHIPSFDRGYKLFWEFYERGAMGKAVHQRACTQVTPFVSLIFAVLFAGATSMSSELILTLFDVTDKAIVTDQLLEGTDAALDYFQFAKAPTTDSLTAFLIIHTCLVRVHDALTTSNAISTAMRVAQSMGIHRDGRQYGLSELDSEIRRRIWWHILHLDVQSSIATGLPPLGGGNEDLYDTAMVSELKDEYIGVMDNKTSPEGIASNQTGAGNPNSSGTQDKSKVSVAMLLAIGRYERAKVLYKILYRLSGVRELLQDEVTKLTFSVSNLKFKIEELRERIVADEAAPIFNTWAKAMLETYCDEAFVILTKPFMKSTKKCIWRAARMCVMKPAHCYLKTLITLSTTPSFQPFYWYCPGTIQPLHAAMVLSLDLHLNPKALEAEDSLKYVKEVFKIFVDDFWCERTDLTRNSGDLKDWEQLRKFMIKKCNQRKSQSECPAAPPNDLPTPNLRVNTSDEPCPEGEDSCITSQATYVETAQQELTVEPDNPPHSQSPVVSIPTWSNSGSSPHSVGGVQESFNQPTFYYETPSSPLKTPQDYYYVPNLDPAIPSPTNLHPPTQQLPYNLSDPPVALHDPAADHAMEDFNWNEWDLIFDNCADLSVEFNDATASVQH